MPADLAVGESGSVAVPPAVFGAGFDAGLVERSSDANINQCTPKSRGFGENAHRIVRSICQCGVQNLSEGSSGRCIGQDGVSSAGRQGRDVKALESKDDG